MAVERADLLVAKQKFIKLYNSGGGRQGVTRDALTSALQRNKLYAQVADKGLRIRNYWAGLLAPAETKYATSQDQSAFEDDMVALAGEMNERFGARFCESGFRLSHAQKSLAVYLKHLWWLRLRGNSASLPDRPDDP